MVQRQASGFVVIHFLLIFFMLSNLYCLLFLFWCVEFNGITSCQLNSSNNNLIVFPSPSSLALCVQSGEVHDTLLLSKTYFVRIIQCFQPGFLCVCVCVQWGWSGGKGRGGLYVLQYIYSDFILTFFFLYKLHPYINGKICSSGVDSY